MRLWYCDHHEIVLPAGHKFPTPKYRLLREALELDGRFKFEPAPFAPADAIARVHDRTYVEAVLSGTVDPKVMRRIGFPWSQGLVHRTLASVGGTLRAMEDALWTGCGGNLAGGTHHAFRSEGAGFCVFNDIAVAVCDGRARHLFERAAILDLDVHQGDGTARIFEDDPQVLTISVHGRDNFPFRKQVSGIDIALTDGAADDEFLVALREVLPRVPAFRPDLVFYQSGVDALASDKLGRLRLTHQGLAERDRAVFAMCSANGLPCVVTLGGGYADPITETVAAHAMTFRMAASVWHCVASRSVRD